VEACGGTHLRSTSEVGLVKILSTERVQDGVERLVFAAGPHALAEVQRMERTLLDVAHLLGAPIEKVREAAINTMETIKRLRHDREIQQQIIETIPYPKLKRKKDLKGEFFVYNPENLDEVNLFHYSYKGGADYLIKVGNDLVKLDPKVVAVMFSEKERRVVVKAGKNAVTKGIHAGKLTSELAKIIGGGGGGNTYFGQGGGGDPKKFQKAVERIRKAVKAQLA